MRPVAIPAGALLLALSGCSVDGLLLPGGAQDAGVDSSPPDLAVCPGPPSRDAGPGVTSVLLDGCTVAPLATPAELATTPRADREAEVLALDATGGFIAPEDVYQRVSRDLANIRCAYPAVSEVHGYLGRIPDPGVFELTFPAPSSAAADLKAGAYHDWDCLNALYGFQVKFPFFYSDHAAVTLESRGRFSVTPLVGEYTRLRGAPSVRLLGRGIDASRTCLHIDGDRYQFYFDLGTGDCPSGCTEHHFWYFTTDRPGRVTLEGEYRDTFGTTRPDWVKGVTCW